VAAAGGAAFVGVSALATGQEPFDRAALDESLKGRLFFYARSRHDGENSGLYTYDLLSRKFEHVLKGVNPDFFCRASPDGKSFAVSESSVASEAVTIIRPDGRTKVSENRTRLFWAPDGRKVIMSEWTEVPFVTKTWQMNPDGTDRVLLSVPKDELVVDWSPDGLWLLIVRREANRDERLGSGPNKPMFLRRADGSEPRLLLAKNPGSSGLGRFSPDSKTVAYVRINHQNREYSVRVIDVTTSRERLVVDGDGKDDPDGNLCWSPDGKYLAVRMMDRTQEESPEPQGHLEILDLQGRRIRWIGVPQKVPVPCNWL
jgi:Tol biopolymer transport system component